MAGAGGFVGTVLCRALRDAGVRVTAAHRRRRDGPWDAQVLCNLPAEALEHEYPLMVDEYALVPDSGSITATAPRTGRNSAGRPTSEAP